ncbi:MAG TPA: protein kinase [Mycobacterium sp.]|nr:protein kinase [Mycobacterium sp.]
MEGTPFGRYRLIELVGRGGMGEVWKAFDTATNRVVALKMLAANVADDPQYEQRFRREALAAAGLTNPHVVSIHNFGEIEGRLYVDMALIEGRDLRSILADGPLQPGRAIAIIEQIASALHAAHRIGLVHRDVKPSNILVDDEDFAYLIDFGIARAVGEKGLTATGNVIGTWAYMAPERLTSGEADPRADIYALACVLHECLTGSQPYPGGSVEQQITGHLTLPPPRPSALRHDLPAELDTVIATGMAKNPDDRYSTVTEMAQAARAAITVPTTQPPSIPPTATEAATPPSRPESAMQVSPPQSAPQPPPPRFEAASPQPLYQAPRMSAPGGWDAGTSTGAGGPTSGGLPWQGPPSGPVPWPQRPKRNWAPIIAAIVAFVVVVTIVVLVVVLIPKFTNSGRTTTAMTTPPTTTSRPRATTRTTPPTTGPTGAAARLITVLPAGYDSGACEPVDPVTDALATVDCDKNSKPGGPEVARYSLFPDQAALDRQFSAAIKEDEALQACPGSSTQSPTTWHYTSTPDKVEGQVACGTFKGGPDIVWTRNEDLLLATGQGPDMNALHEWWVKFG